MMLEFVGLAFAFVLLLAGLLHLLWAARIWWPLSEERALAGAVVGAKEISAMPPSVASFAAAIFLLIASLVTLMQSGWLGFPGLWLRWAALRAGILLAVVFAVRGVVGYTAVWQRLTPQEPFRTLDRRIYSPLCLLLAAAFIGLLI